MIYDEYEWYFIHLAMVRSHCIRISEGPLLMLFVYVPQESMELNVSEPIPKKRFTVITTSIIALTLVIAILIPRGEFST